MFEEQTKVLVVGDESDSLAGLDAYLSGQGFTVMRAKGEEEFRATHSSWKPNVILLDPGPDTVQGFLLCERVRAADPGVVIIVLSDHNSEEHEVWGLDAGADDYITKPFSLEVLLARIRANIRARRAAGERRIVETGDLQIDVRNYAVWVKGNWVDLRPQEFRVLVSLAQSYGEPLSRQELVRRVGGQWRGNSSRTVDVQISRIRTAIETQSDYRYIHTVERLGYRFEPVRKEVSPSDNALRTRQGARKVSF